MSNHDFASEYESKSPQFFESPGFPGGAAVVSGGVVVVGGAVVSGGVVVVGGAVVSGGVVVAGVSVVVGALV